MNQSTTRQTFLKRVREAVNSGNRAGGRPELPDRGGVGYHGGGDDWVAFFRDELVKVGGFFHAAPSPSDAVRIIGDLIEKWNAKSILLGRGEYLDRLELRSTLEIGCCQIVVADETSEQDRRDQFFSADAGVTGVDFLIAETGTIVVTSKVNDPRSVSLLPPYHIAVAHQDQIKPDLFDVFDATSGKAPPANLNLITGPSKTGDIELRLVTGVHGPKEVHVIVLAG